MKLSELSYEHQQAIEAMKSQLLIVLVNRLGGNVEIPAEEIDGTGKFNMTLQVVDRVFHFRVVAKERTK